MLIYAKYKNKLSDKVNEYNDYNTLCVSNRLTLIDYFSKIW
jgi:hypothetical protein